MANLKEEAAGTAGLTPTLPLTMAVLTKEAGPSPVERNTTSMAERQFHTSPETIGSNRAEKSGFQDVAEADRKNFSVQVKEKFSDIFQVGESSCEVLEESVLQNVKEVNVAGRLSLPQSVNFFQSIGAPEFILSVLRDGHFSKFKGPVPPLERKNNGSFYKHENWAIQEVKKWIQEGKVEIVTERPYCVNPLHVVVQPKKKRLILDCSDLNDFIITPKFKLDDYKVALNYFKEKGFLFIYDMRDGYFHVKLHKDFRKYLGFKLLIDGKLVYGQFCVGFLGLSDMPWLFTKIFRVLIKHWRSLHIKSVIYLDDGWNFHKSLVVAREASRHIRSDLLRAGVVWSIKKCVWEPTREVEWLGMVWNAENLTLKISGTRIDKLKASISKLLDWKHFSICQLASVVGQIISLGPVMGNITRLRSRFAQMEIARAESYDISVELTSLVARELVFWLENVVSLNCRSCVQEQAPISIEIKGDASARGCGSFIVNSLVKTARLFSPEEQNLHSTWREMENVRFLIEAMLEHVKGRSVNFLIDNKSAVQIIQNGSMKLLCHDLALKIDNLCKANSIVLNVQWIPRGDNVDADDLSRLADRLDTDDWGLSLQFFQLLNNKFGPFSVDCFANFYNNKVEKFYSLFLTPNTSGVNAFAFDWHRENCLLVPPVAIIGRVLFHLRTCRAKGVLVAPLWKSAYYWPLICSDFQPFIKDVLVVKASNVLVQGRNKNSLLGSDSFSSMMLALQLDCSLTGF